MMNKTPTAQHKVACTDCFKNKWMIPVCLLSLKSASSFEDKIGQNEKIITVYEERKLMQIVLQTSPTKVPVLLNNRCQLIEILEGVSNLKRWVLDERHAPERQNGTALATPSGPFSHPSWPPGNEQLCSTMCFLS